MSNSNLIIGLCVFAILGASTAAQADDTPPKVDSKDQGKPIGWKDPRPAASPSADNTDRSRERRSVLEERVRYLEEQAATMARDLEAERHRRAALETSAEAARREADELRARMRAEQQSARKVTLRPEPSRSQERARQAAQTIEGNRAIVKSSFSLPNALRPIRF